MVALFANLVSVVALFESEVLAKKVSEAITRRFIHYLNLAPSEGRGSGPAPAAVLGPAPAARMPEKRSNLLIIRLEIGPFPVLLLLLLSKHTQHLKLGWASRSLRSIF